MIRRAAAAAGALLADGPALLLAIPLWVWWATWDGGYPVTVWAPGLAYLALAALLLARFARPAALDRPRLVALAGLAALAAWSTLSLLWADDTDFASSGALRLWLLLAAFALPLLWPPGRRALVAALAVWPLACLAGVVSGLAAALAQPERLDDGRLLMPTGYPNATAALCLMGALPALVLASRRERDPALRIAALPVGGVLLAASLLTQSRGAALSAAVVLALALALVPSRLRLLAPLALALAGAAAVAPTLLDVRNATLAGVPEHALDDAVTALLALGFGLLLLAVAYVALDLRVAPSKAAMRRLNHAAAAATCLAVVAGAVAFAVAVGSPVHWLHDRYDSFTHPHYATLEQADTRFTGDLGSNRSDYWRVALAVAADKPLLGAGMGNFAAPYLARRHTAKAPRFAHSVWLGTLAELGIAGLVALLAFCGGWLAALATRLRGASAEGRALAAAAALPLLVVLVHASGDWIDAFAALTIPAAGLAAAAVASARGAAADRRRLPWGLAAALTLAALAAIPVFAAATLTASGLAAAHRDPAAALADLRRAQSLDPLAVIPARAEGIVALEAHRQRRAAAAFERAAARDPSDWFSRFELGLLAAVRGERAAALRQLAGARARNPREALVRQAQRAVRAGRPVDPLRALRTVLAQPA
ncbi:MAG: O-antigen ligase family protein [Actinobacteria bacterium]|nr:O-antigen ligase family protein [Actinomycetota bacterium]